MKERIVIKNVPMRYPFSLTAVTYLLIDKFHVSELVFGGLCVIFLMIWIIVIIDKWNCKTVDIFEGEKEYDPKTYRSNFKQRMEDLADKKK